MARSIAPALVLAAIVWSSACDGEPPHASATVTPASAAQPAPVPVPAASAIPPPSTGPVQVEMKNVRLHAAADVILDARSIRGEMVSRDPARPPVFDDQRSFTLKMFDADVEMDTTSLANLMNGHVFAYEGAPLKDLAITVDKGRLVQKGKMHKGLWVPFTMTATVSAAADGRLKIHMESVSVLNVPSTKLLDLFGLKLEDVMAIKANRGVEIQDDDILVDVGRVVPPPEIQGKLVLAEIVNGRLHQRFSSTDGTTAPPLRPPPAGVRNYIFFSGSRIRFGKLTMDDADLRLIDADPRDPFDFFSERYLDQLVAGYSKSTRVQGLETFVPDFADLGTMTNLKPR